MVNIILTITFSIAFLGLMGIFGYTVYKILKDIDKF